MTPMLINLFTSIELITVLFLDRTIYSATCLSITVVPNRGSAAHLSAVSWCQGCRQLMQFLDLYTYLTILRRRQIFTVRVLPTKKTGWETLVCCLERASISTFIQSGKSCGRGRGGTLNLLSFEVR